MTIIDNHHTTIQYKTPDTIVYSSEHHTDNTNNNHAKNNYINGINGINFVKCCKNIKPLLIRQYHSSPSSSCFNLHEHISNIINQLSLNYHLPSSSSSSSYSYNQNHLSIQVLTSLDNRHFLDDHRYCEKLDIEPHLFNQKLLNRIQNNMKTIEKSNTHDLNDNNTTCQTINNPKNRYYFRTNAEKIDFDITPYQNIIEVLYTDNLKDTSTIPQEQKEILPDVVPQIKPHLVQLWLSDQGCVTPLHFDKCHGLLVQLSGRKRFIVYDRREGTNFYLHDGVSGPTHATKVLNLSDLYDPVPFAEQSSSPLSGDKYIPSSFIKTQEKQIDCDNIDIIQKKKWMKKVFPSLSETTPYIIDLHPGDILYTPPGWMHEVVSVDTSLSVTIPIDMCEDEKFHLPSYMMF